MSTETTKPGFARLKELLLDSEARQLQSVHDDVARLRTRVEALDQRTGTDERLTSSVAHVLDGALRHAEANKHEAMSGAVAPLVVKTIKTEFRNSRDEMVEALYPITGRLVKAYVASAIKDLSDEINRRLQQNSLMLRLQSLTTGRSAGQIAIADSQRLRVEDVLLIRRGSGELLARHPEGVEGKLSNSDIQMSGLMTAINEFATEAFASDGGSMRSFKFDDFQVYLRASPQFLVVARARGIAPPGIETMLDDAFLATLETPEFKAVTQPGAVLTGGSKAILPRLASSLDARVADAHDQLASGSLGFNPLKWLAILLIGGIAAWFAWSTYVDWMTRLARREAVATIAATPGMTGYPTTLRVSPMGREITISGLTPDPITKADVIRRLSEALPKSRFEDQLSVLPRTGTDTRPEVAQVRRDMAVFQREMTLAGIGRALARAGARVGQTRTELTALSGLVGDDAAKRRTLANLETRLAAIAGDIEAHRAAASAAATTDDRGAPARVARELPKTTAALNAAAQRLSGLLGASPALANAPDATPADAPSTTSADADPALLADDLAAASERVQTLAVAVSQAGRIKPVIVMPTPPPPPAPPPAGPTPLQELMDWTRQNAVFFSNGTDLRDADEVARTLDTLARLLGRTDARVRIVGYTDGRGNADRNSTLAQTRADSIRQLLVDRGIAPARLVAIGRANALDLSQVTGADSPNRRVEFELAFRTEPSASGP